MGTGLRVCVSRIAGTDIRRVAVMLSAAKHLYLLAATCYFIGDLSY